jgi:hypothetical protein
MKLVDIFAKWFGMSGPVLVALLLRLKELAPDSAAIIDMMLAKLDAAATPENILAFATFVMQEGGDVLQGKFKGEPHPSDLA